MTAVLLLLLLQQPQHPHTADEPGAERREESQRASAVTMGPQEAEVKGAMAMGELAGKEWFGRAKQRENIHQLIEWGRRKIIC